jgi:anti-sigma28 factor (negative regulator of flagellin synthesis)
MEIKQVASVYKAMGYESVSSVTKKQSYTSSNSASTSETVELSESSQNLQNIKEAVYYTPEIRLPTVEEIKEKIKNNDYPINTHIDEAIENMVSAGIFS